jgi:hypothetical protein
VLFTLAFGQKTEMSGSFQMSSMKVIQLEQLPLVHGYVVLDGWPPSSTVDVAQKYLVLRVVGRLGQPPRLGDDRVDVGLSARSVLVAVADSAAGHMPAATERGDAKLLDVLIRRMRAVLAHPVEKALAGAVAGRSPKPGLRSATPPRAPAAQRRYRAAVARTLRPPGRRVSSSPSTFLLAADGERRIRAAHNPDCYEG